MASRRQTLQLGQVSFYHKRRGKKEDKTIKEHNQLNVEEGLHHCFFYIIIIIIVVYFSFNFSTT